jgi:hypothetical protein
MPKSINGPKANLCVGFFHVLPRFLSSDFGTEDTILSGAKEAARAGVGIGQSGVRMGQLM